MRNVLLVLLSVLLVSASFAGTITGKVTGKASGDPLVGANVYLQGMPVGAATDEGGMYSFDAKDGSYILVCDYVGYAKQTMSIDVSETVTYDFAMVEFLFAKTISVVADRAKDRETPVAFSNVEKERMTHTLASQDIPMVLNTTPSVYATMQGNGAGDARINVRGFDQRNVAIMINGVPMNDMENGWVYWSNWDGVGDATSSIQIQRGLSASNLATPAIGGSMNIITDPTAQNAGVLLRQEFGNDAFLKTTFSGHTGLMNDKWAASATVVRKVGNGLMDGTWTDAWAWYVGAAYNINENNRLELYGLGAPQRHGQNLYKQNIAAYSHKFARSLKDYDNAALDAFAEAGSGQKYNQNYNKASSSYDGQQNWNESNYDRYDPNFINERENFFHKPLVNLNWFSQISNSLSLYTILYWSGGSGGGTGTSGSMEWDYSGPSRIIDWDATIAENEANATAGDGSSGILRNSRNNQNTYGAIAKVFWKMTDNWQTSFGVDWRTAEIEHYREVRDLLGGSYYERTDSDFWGGPRQLKLGDKFDYNNTNTVDWIGFYGQVEYTKDRLTLVGLGAYTMIKYGFTDHFTADENDPTKETVLESDNITGYQVKGGASFRVSKEVDVYGNVGYVSKVPIFDAVIIDYSAAMAEDPKNEIFTHLEGGVNWRTLDGRLYIKSSLYYTIWTDRTRNLGVTNPDGTEGVIFLTGMDQTHMGLEFEAVFQPSDIFRFDLAWMFASWKHTNDMQGSYRDYENPTPTPFFYPVKDLYIGDAPQLGGSLGFTLFPSQGFSMSLIYRYYTNHYAQWDPFGRAADDPDDPSTYDRGQAWKMPGFGLADFHLTYNIPGNWKGLGVTVFAHVLNLFDTVYISDGVDNSSYNAYRVGGDIVNPHKADAAEVFLGPPLSFTLGLQLNY
ncbi:MAG: TonB-dependent receptor [Calditrichia bacterium]|nr:TonB-dependent receptor [Calditrichia bacterium]